MSEYVTMFGDAHVNGKMLVDGLTDEDLEEIGVLKRIHRKRILKELHDLTVNPYDSIGLFGYPKRFPTTRE